MDTNTLLTELSNGELRNVSLNQGGAEGTISDKMLKSIIGYTNDVLTDLHTRFLIKEKSVLLLTRAGVTLYPLRTEFSRVSGTYDGPRHIDDFNGEPFSEDFIKISEIFDKYGTKLSLNDSNDVLSVYTPEYDVVQIPGVFDGDLFSVSYQVGHPILTVDNLALKIELPRFMVPILKLGVAARFYSHLNGEEHSAKAMTYTAQYEALCRNILENDMTLTSEVVTNVKLEQRGFK